jgi:hypothetical protein
MQIHDRTGVLAAAWILAAGTTGFVANVTTVGAATTLLGFALVPPLLMLMRWIDPAQALSKNIHQTPR